MGLITKEVEIQPVFETIKYFSNKGYSIPRRKDNKGRITIARGTKIIVKVEDLPKYSKVKVIVECDGCNKIIFNLLF